MAAYARTFSVDSKLQNSKQQFIDSINTIYDGVYTFSDHIPWDADLSNETIFDLTQNDIKHIVNLKHVKTHYITIKKMILVVGNAHKL